VQTQSTEQISSWEANVQSVTHETLTYNENQKLINVFATVYIRHLYRGKKTDFFKNKLIFVIETIFV